jgi:peroxiredoxin Q/BCP
MLLNVFWSPGDSPDTNAAFAKAQRLPFPLLSDEGNDFRKALGVKKDLFGLLPGRQVCPAHLQA